MASRNRSGKDESAALLDAALTRIQRDFGEGAIMTAPESLPIEARAELSWLLEGKHA